MEDHTHATNVDSGLAPYEIRRMILDQLCALHELCIEGPGLASKEDAFDKIIQPFIKPKGCLKCFKKHAPEAGCQGIAKTLLPGHKGYRKVSVIFPFSKPRKLAFPHHSNDKTYFFGCMSARVADGGHLDGILDDTISYTERVTSFPASKISIGSTMTVYAKNKQEIVFQVKVHKIIGSDDKSHVAKPLTNYALEHLKDSILNITPRRAHFRAWMRKQLFSAIMFYSNYDTSDLDPYRDDLLYPPICFYCGSWHDTKKTPCIPNILLMQQHVPISRNIKVRYSILKDKYITSTLLLLDGGNFKYETTKDGPTRAWTLATYRDLNTTKRMRVEMCLYLPDAFVLREHEVEPNETFFCDSTWRKDNWVKYWYPDPSPEELDKYLANETQKDKTRLIPYAAEQQKEEAWLQNEYRRSHGLTYPWIPKDYFKAFLHHTVLIAAVPANYDESVEEWYTKNDEFHHRKPLDLAIPFFSS